MSDNNKSTNDSITEIDEVFAEDAGTLVFQSSLMRYVSEIEDDEAKDFEDFIEAHVTEEEFIGALFENYPKFKDIFEEEMSALQMEMKEMVGQNE